MKNEPYALIECRDERGYCIALLRSACERSSDPGSGRGKCSLHVPCGPEETAERMVYIPGPNYEDAACADARFALPYDDAAFGVTQTVVAGNKPTFRTFVFPENYLLACLMPDAERIHKDLALGSGWQMRHGLTEGDTPTVDGASVSR